MFYFPMQFVFIIVALLQIGKRFCANEMRFLHGSNYFYFIKKGVCKRKVRAFLFYFTNLFTSQLPPLST